MSHDLSWSNSSQCKNPKDKQRPAEYLTTMALHQHSQQSQIEYQLTWGPSSGLVWPAIFSDLLLLFVLKVNGSETALPLGYALNLVH